MTAHPRLSLTRLWALPALAAGLLCACGPSGGAHEITESRVRETNRVENLRPFSSAERFGMASPGHGGGGAPAPGALRFKFDLPQGWKELPPARFKDVNLAIEGRPDVDCYLTVLSGSGGGAAANVNRWRGQMGLAPLAPSDVDGLPRESMLGREALYCYFEGKEDSALAGMIVELPMAAIFMKLSGSRADVQAEEERFKAFCASLRADLGGGGGAPAAGPALPEGPDPAGLTWTAPDGWRDAGARSMRVVTFVPESRPDLQCYISVLSGSAGGLFDNVNRWRGQLGLPPASKPEVDQLATLTVLGQEAPYVDLVDPEGGQGMLALACPLGSSTLFVKMVGPAADVEAERVNFLAFCQSLGN